ncbi:DNA polymerase [Sinomonas soli]
MTAATAELAGQAHLASLEFLPAGVDNAAFGNWLDRATPGILALDCETTGLNTRSPSFKVRQLSFGTPSGQAVVIDGADTALVRSCLGQAVRSGRQIWAHNATFDANAIFAAYGVRLRRLRCSLTLAKTLDPDIIGTGQGGLKKLRPAAAESLERLAAHWGRLSGRAVDPEGEHSWLPDAVAALPEDDPHLLDYVATDATECARLVADWRSIVDDDEWELAILETEVEDLWRWPAARGYLIDDELLKRRIAELTALREQSLQRFGLDLTSNSNATRAWVAARGIRIRDRDGKPTLSHKAFERAFVPSAAQDDWAAFTELRSAAGTANKLGELRTSLEAGRIHPTIKGIGANTGRMSISKPAIQNLQADLRPLLLAEPGHVLVGADLNRVEPCVIAALSQDPGLIEGVKEDLYEELAVAVYGAEARGDNQARKVAKKAFLAIAYGQGTAALASDLGVEDTAAAEVIDGIKRAYPVMSRWMDEIRADARRGRILATAYGRRLPCTPHKPYRAVNWVIQGTAADLFKRITVRVAELLSREALYLPVHDELIVQVPQAEVKGAEAVLRAAMSVELNGVQISGNPVVLSERLGHA